MRWILLWLFCLSLSGWGERFEPRYVPVEAVVQWLSGRHPEVAFVVEGNGLKATASDPARLQKVRDDLRLVDNEESESRRVSVRHGDRREVASLLLTLVPDLLIVPGDGTELLLIGSVGALEQAIGLVNQLDRPLDPVRVECLLLSKLPAILNVEEDGPRVQRWNQGSKSVRAVSIGFLLRADEVPEELILARKVVDGLSGEELLLSLKTSELGIHLEIAANVKADGYIVCRILPVVTLTGNRTRKVTTDARIKSGESLVLGGLGEAQELGLPGSGPVFVVVTPSLP